MAKAGVPWAILCSAALDRNCAGMFVRCTSSTRSCSERWLSSRVVATLLAIVPLLLLEPTRRPLLSVDDLDKQRPLKLQEALKKLALGIRKDRMSAAWTALGVCSDDQYLHAARAAAPSNSTATTQREEECRRTESESR